MSPLCQPVFCYSWVSNQGIRVTCVMSSRFHPVQCLALVGVALIVGVELHFFSHLCDINHMQCFSFVNVFWVLIPAPGWFYYLAVAASMLLVISCDVYHARNKLLGAGAFRLSLRCMHFSYVSFLVWASSECLVCLWRGVSCLCFVHGLCSFV
jgi:hypothetical protein